MIPFRGRLDPLWAVILLAVLLRGAVMAWRPGAFDDLDNYLPLAQSLASGDGFVLKGRATAYRPPLYPLMLAPLVANNGAASFTGIALLHLALGAGTVWLTATAARGSGLSRNRALFAAFIVACDPVLVWQSRSVMTETPTAFLLALGFAGLCRPGTWGPVLGGAGLGLAALCRPSVLPGTLLTIAAAAIARPGSASARLVRAGMIAAAVLIVLSPWMIRNFVQFGEPIWTTTHGGYTLALANNPVYYREVLDGPPGRVWTGHDQWIWWDSVNRKTSGMSEAQADRFLRDEALRLARAEPAAFRTRDDRAAGAFLGGRSGRFGLSGTGSMGDPDLDNSALSSRSRRPLPAEGLVMAAGIGAAGDPGPHHCPRVLLDRPADAGADRSGHRIGRGRRTGPRP